MNRFFGGEEKSFLKRKKEKKRVSETGCSEKKSHHLLQP
jgi:hypothetical protein